MKKKFKVFILIAYSILIFLFVTYTFRFTLKKFVNKFSKEYITQINLDSTEKIEDFQSMYNMIQDNMLSLDEYSQLYSTDFLGRKSFYEEQIRKTKTDFEFYCVMKAIVADIPSFHTDLLYPSINTYESLNCYNNDSLLATKNIDDYAYYWRNLLRKNVSENKFFLF